MEFSITKDLYARYLLYELPKILLLQTLQSYNNEDLDLFSFNLVSLIKVFVISLFFFWFCFFFLSFVFVFVCVELCVCGAVEKEDMSIKKGKREIKRKSNMRSNSKR